MRNCKVAKYNYEAKDKLAAAGRKHCIPLLPLLVSLLNSKTRSSEDDELARHASS